MTVIVRHSEIEFVSSVESADQLVKHSADIYLQTNIPMMFQSCTRIVVAPRCIIPAVVNSTSLARLIKRGAFEAWVLTALSFGVLCILIISNLYSQTMVVHESGRILLLLNYGIPASVVYGFGLQIIRSDVLRLIAAVVFLALIMIIPLYWWIVRVDYLKRGKLPLLLHILGTADVSMEWQTSRWLCYFNRTNSIARVTSAPST